MMKATRWDTWITLVMMLCLFLFVGAVPTGADTIDPPVHGFQSAAQEPINGVLGAQSLGLKRVSDQQVRQVMSQTMSATDSPQTALQAAAAIVNQQAAAHSALAGGTKTLFSVVEKRTATDTAGNTHVRIKQYYQGIPIVGAELIVHMRNGVIYRTTGKYLPFADVRTTPTIDADTAIQAGIAAADKIAADTSLPDSASLVIFNNRLAYNFELKQEGAEWGIWKYYVDAHAGQILMRYNNIQHAEPVQGSGIPSNVTGNLLAGEGGGGVTIEGFFENSGSSNYFLYNFDNLWGVFDLNLTLDASDDDWEQQAASAWGANDPAAVSLANNAAITQNYVSTVLGMNSFDDRGAFAQLNVHQADPNTDDPNYVNAFWDGTDFHFGDGDGSLASELTVLDIMAHEYGHAITQHSSSLVYWMQSGALNEAYSDIFGALVEFDDQTLAADTQNPGAGQADWLIGEDCWLAGIAARSMANPLLMGDPSYYKGTNWWFGISDNGGVHTNSGVLNMAFYLLAEGGTGTNDGHAYSLTGLGIEDAGSIAMQANMFYHTSTDNYYDARDAWRDAADDLGFDPLAIDAVFNAVGVPSFMTSQMPATNVASLPSQNFTDLGSALYVADDFTFSQSEAVINIALHTTLGNDATSLFNATALNFYLYGDSGGVPSGHPSEATNTYLWHISLDPLDTQLTITETLIQLDPTLYHSHVNLKLSGPVTLPAGTYWLVFVPEMTQAPNGQSYWTMSPSGSGSTAQVIDPNDLVSWPATWTPITSTSVGASHSAMAFEIESTNQSFPQHTVDFLAGANGDLTGLTSQIVLDGGSSTAVTPVPDPGYIFDQWTGDYIGTDNPLIVTNVTSSMTITANFVASPQYTVTFTAGANGSLSGMNSQSVYYGEDCASVRAVPDSGYQFNRWTGDFTGIGNPLTLTNVTSDMTIYANFTQSISDPGGGGGGGCFIGAASRFQ